MRGDPFALKLTFIPVLAAFTAYWFWSGLFAAPAGWAEGGRIASRIRDYLDTHSRTSWFLGIIGWIIVLLWVRTALPMIAAMLYGPFGGGLREYYHYKRLAAPHMPSTAA